MSFIRHSMFVLAFLILVAAVAIGQSFSSKQVTVYGRTFNAVFPGGLNTAYVNVDSLGQAIGLSVDIGRDWVNVVQGGTVLRFSLADTALEGSRFERGMGVNGKLMSSPAAGYQGGDVFVPLRAVIETLGGAMQDSGGQIAVQFPQLRLEQVTQSKGDSADRAVLELSHQSGFELRIDGDEAVISIANAVGEPVQYAVDGRFIKTVEIRVAEQLLEARIRLPVGSGVRVLALGVKPGSDSSDMKGRIAIDVGPGFLRPGSTFFGRPVEVVLDAGHGGADFGVTDGLLNEKNLTLSIARLVSASLEKKGIRVKLTRAFDNNPSFKNRLETLLTADSFVSFHVSNLPDSSASGVSVYSFDKTVTHEGILRAIREDLAANPSKEHRILLEQFVEPATASEALADAVVGRIEALENPKISAQALITSTQILLSRAPKAAILVELGWLSNPEDRARLNNRKEIERLAQAVTLGLLDHLAPLIAVRSSKTVSSQFLIPSTPATRRP